jgi:putative transposase
MRKEWFSAKDLVGLPGMPEEEETVHATAQREGWRFDDVKSRGRNGRRREYHIDSLPADSIPLLVLRYPDPDEEPHAPLPAVLKLALPATTAQVNTLKDWQRRGFEARLLVLRELQRLEKHLGTNKAIAELIRLGREGQLPAALQDALDVANRRNGGTKTARLVDRSTLLRWRKLAKQGGTALAPKDGSRSHEGTVPAWGKDLLKAFRQPTKPSLKNAVEDLQGEGVDFSYGQARRFLGRMSRLDVERGRLGPSALRARKYYRKRNKDDLYPLDVCANDGHSFKARVAHPVHGRPFHPEVCAVVDVATRVCIGWSAGLAESSWTVADALRHAVTVDDRKPYGGIPAIFQTDPGAGPTADVNANELTGLYARLGITYKTVGVGNPQANGVVERPQSTLWIRAAKKLPTYTGKDMDRQVARRVYLTVEKDLRTHGESVLLPSWREFLAFCDETVAKYNRRPHSELPLITDPVTGRRRHMWPVEAWDAFLSEGWRPELPTADELDGLFRPWIRVKARRGRVRVFTNDYQCPAVLEHYDGEFVLVEYDIHDATKVRVRDSQHRLLCEAQFDEGSGYYPKPVIEQAREQRRKNRLTTLKRHEEEIELEAKGPQGRLVAAVALTPEQEASAARLLQEPPPAPAPALDATFQRLEDRPGHPHGWPRLPRNAQEKYEWLCEARGRGEALSAQEQAFLEGHERHYFGGLDEAATG